MKVCKLQNGDVAGRFDCSMLSCASKAPRVLTGFLASTAHPPQASGRIVPIMLFSVIFMITYMQCWDALN